MWKQGQRNRPQTGYADLVNCLIYLNVKSIYWLVRMSVQAFPVEFRDVSPVELGRTRIDKTHQAGVELGRQFRELRIQSYFPRLYNP